MGLLLAAIAALLSSSLACTSGSAHAGDEPVVQVVASFYPLAFFATEVGGEAVRVETLVPLGIEPHDWEPAPQDIVALDRAQLFIYNGGGLEPWIQRTLTNLRFDGLVVVEASHGVDLLRGRGDSETAAHRDQENHDTRGFNPHIWLDPVLAQHQVRLIRNALAKADPEHRETYQANAKQLTEKLAALDERFRQELAACARRTVITSHAAHTYLAQRYDFEIISIAGLSPEASPSPLRLTEIVQLARERGIHNTLADPLENSAYARVIAREIGGELLALNALEGLTQEERVAGLDYLSIMAMNLTVLRTALGCQ